MLAKFASVAVLAVAASAQAAMSPTDYATGLLGALGAANLTVLTKIATANAATLLPLLMGGNKTTDAAFAAVDPAVLANATLVGEIVIYHIISGSFPASALTAAHTIAQSSLNTTDLVHLLPAGTPQAIVLSTSDNMTVSVIQPTTNVTSLATAVYQNLIVHIVPAVLTVPGLVSATAAAAGLTSLVGAIQLAGLASAADNTAGLTIFAPSNAAFAAVASVVGTLNASVVATVLENHIINGPAVYSSLISNGLKATSLAGQPITLTTNATGVYVTSGPVTAKIIRTDVLVNNGVVHVIDAVLANTASAPAAASSAMSAATAATSMSAAATGAITASAAGTAAATGTAAAPAATAAKAGAARLAAGIFGVAGFVAALLV